MPNLPTLISDLGDASLIAPLSCIVSVYFALRRASSSCYAWITALLFCIAITVVLKLCFGTCGAAFPFLNIRSPSGHVSLSTTFYLCSGIAISQQAKPWLRLSVLFLGVSLVIAIGASRIELHAHTIAEVVFGALAGVISTTWFAVRYSRHDPAVLDWRIIVGFYPLLVLLAHGLHVSLEQEIVAIVEVLRPHLSACTPA